MMLFWRMLFSFLIVFIRFTVNSNSKLLISTPKSVDGGEAEVICFETK